jgi:arginine-tRNA-protein transferase
VLTELDYARRRNIPHLYLGYWIQQNQSMNYKAGYVPHELLNSFVDDQVEPVWQRASIMVEPTDAA